MEWVAELEGPYSWLSGIPPDLLVRWRIRFDARDASRSTTIFDAIAFTPGIQLRLGHVAERQARLENPIKQALRSTALGLRLDPSALLAGFDKHWTFLPERQQKGVDALITLDLVRLAERHAYDTAILLAGDRDLAEAVRTAQDGGKRVIVATPSRACLARELAQLADAIIDLDDSVLRRMLNPRGSGPQAPHSHGYRRAIQGANAPTGNAEARLRGDARQGDG